MCLGYFAFKRQLCWPYMIGIFLSCYFFLSFFNFIDLQQYKGESERKGKEYFSLLFYGFNMNCF